MLSLLLLPLSSLKAVSPKIIKFLSRLVGQNKVFDLLLHRPKAVEKILFCPRLFELSNDNLIIIKAKVESHIKPNTKRQPYKVICYTPTGYLNLVFFKIFPNQIARMLPGSEIAVLGYLQKISGENQIIHPQEILPAAQIEKLPKINIVYPLAAGITQKFLRQQIEEVLKKINSANKKPPTWPEWPEWIDENLLHKQQWPDLGTALVNIHNPESENDFLPLNPSRQRLAYDELLAWQITILLAKKRAANQVKNQSQKINSIKEMPDLTQEFLAGLPFLLTKSQLKAITEITAEICSDKKMLRLLQGDVGSGKTIIAIAACLKAISQSKQTCIIAPTTILAKQHLAYFKKFLAATTIKVEILTGAITKKQKKTILDNLEQGIIDILIGTHAILEDDVKFYNLGLAVIDEQHRFGVLQRLKLVEKGSNVDVLLMSATPIPRSLMMSLYGDMDISILSEKPQNRQKITTLVMSAKKIAEVYEAIKRAISQGNKIYWICPVIDENEETQLAGVSKKFSELAEVFGQEAVALLHGKMKEKEKEEVMIKFAGSDSEIRLLVATTVIEVGIDVPDATIILIENAENFGLSQLHQLRGRVGRSDKASFCFLLYGQKFGVSGRKRLNILRQSNDGFFIAEEDLKIRGSGEVLGTRQSGFPEFKIANLAFDSDLLKIASKNAELILRNSGNPQKRPQIHKQYHELVFSLDETYQNLLRLFGYDECLKMINSG
jgi:ATP-dependent DNA helicase RecG